MDRRASSFHRIGCSLLTVGNTSKHIVRSNGLVTGDKGYTPYVRLSSLIFRIRVEWPTLNAPRNQPIRRVSTFCLCGAGPVNNFRF